jgi:hypothetical protein
MACYPVTNFAYPRHQSHFFWAYLAHPHVIKSNISYRGKFRLAQPDQVLLAEFLQNKFRAVEKLSSSPRQLQVVLFFRNVKITLKLSADSADYN